jgi:transposase
MTERLPLTTERVDTIPLVLAQLERMGVQALLDEHVPTHGNGVGLSLGWVSVLWLTHIRSEADQRLNHVKSWAEQRLHTRREGTGQLVHPCDVSDDRLATVLETVSDDPRWNAWEGARNQQVRRVYDLEPACVRLARTTASGHWTVTADGLFPFGHSKDHRPDLPQVKVMVSALDPLGRACIQAEGDYSLCPLAERPRLPTVWAGDLAPGWTGEPAVTRIRRPQQDGTPELIAEGCERLEPVTAEGAGPLHRWLERRVVSRSCQLAQAGERGLRARRAKAQAAVTALNQHGRGPRRGPDPSGLRAAVAAMLARSRVHGRRHLRDTEQLGQRPVRRYGLRAATGHLEWAVQVTVSRDQEAVAAAVRQLGGRVYVTTPPPAQLSLQEAVRAYRREDVVERARGRLKGRPLSLTPMDLERDDHATGWIRLLSIGLRVLTRLEFGGRRRLATAKTTLAGLYVGNPKRATAHPTAERLLEALQGLTLTLIREGRRWRRHLPPLSRVHQRILARLDFPVDIYTRLCPDSRKPP